MRYYNTIDSAINPSPSDGNTVTGNTSDQQPAATDTIWEDMKWWTVSTIKALHVDLVTELQCILLSSGCSRMLER